MVDESIDGEFEWQEVADGRKNERTGPSRRTFLKSTGAVASATMLFDAADTAKGAIPEKPDTVDSLTASAAVLAQQSASLCGSGGITFADQRSNGSSVVVESVTLSAGGFVDIHDERLSDAPIDALESVIGVSGYLGPGIHRNVTVPLFDVPGKTFDRTALDAAQTLTAMAHHDTDADEAYDFVALNGAEDRPYLNDDASTVSDSAAVTVATRPRRNTLRIEGTGPRAEYAFAVTGSLTGESLTVEDEITGPLAVGAVGPGEDTYEFTGELTGFLVDDTVRVFVNGTRITDFTQFPPTTLRIEGSGPRAEYAFSVSGSLAGESLTREDDITGSSATGAVGPSADTYYFSGGFSHFDLDGDATVSVNGTTIDPAQFPPNVLTIQGSGSRADYSFSVSGSLAGESLTREDRIRGSSATGAVGPGADTYYFSGEFTRFDLDGDATVSVNGTTIDPARPNTVTIRGSGTRADYSFSVSGALTGESLTREDSISRDGTSATGAVGPGMDSYAYSGTITKFTLDGEATVLVNTEVVNPAQF